MRSSARRSPSTRCWSAAPPSSPRCSCPTRATSAWATWRCCSSRCSRSMHKNVLFRGCTRPAMIMGVPYVPFAFGAGGCFLLAVYVNFFCLLLLPAVIFVMRQMARRDEMIFRLLGLDRSEERRVGKEGVSRVDLGGRRIIKKKKKIEYNGKKTTRYKTKRQTLKQ